MPPEPTPAPLYPERLTWAALLGRWVDFARSALALPDDPQGRRLRDAVPDIIMLQAITFALEEVDELEPDQLGLALDRAELLIDRHADNLAARWAPEEPPAPILDLVRDARERLAAAQQAG